MLKRYLINILEKIVVFKHHFVNPEKEIKKVFKSRVGYSPNLSNPATFNEKMQWLKLHDHNPLYTRLVDKAEVKGYVASIIGQEYVIPTLGVWDRWEDIDFNSLPNQFVLKCTHDSGGIVICKDKSKFDFKKAKKKLTACLRRNFYYYGFEWPYKNVKPRIIAEEYLEDTDIGDLIDYKFFVFNGKAKAFFTVSDRNNPNVPTGFNFFDIDLNPLPFERGYPKSPHPVVLPENTGKMVELAQQLAQNIPFLRVDFYEVNNRILLGELTLYPGSGWEKFTPEEWDLNFGNLLKLPECMM